ncbi:hypothetical protein EDD75_1546 [Thermodesulfitimonas autotrophica]|uniref:Uncharacterized protein n=1 Tax=Thermodesulfitimonas autotrophica TaxID=1894989 RepID=A0A3N5B9V4_9THEO|nr:hypothetical protein [Thermodesulfitimonas autotrophica]RPF42445.1 hypothetical protein EDD75_1546 [Thermodesulfitimonas autotrophica]
MADYKTQDLIWFIILFLLAPFILFLILLWLIIACPNEVLPGGSQAGAV